MIGEIYLIPILKVNISNCCLVNVFSLFFIGLPADWSDPNYKVPTEAKCIIDILGAKHKDMITESKYVKEYTWKALIQNMFKEKILHGNDKNFTDLLTASNFDANMKSITKAYEEHLLNKGDFDERILLGE